VFSSASMKSSVKISPEEITFVFQGSIGSLEDSEALKLTEFCVRKTRETFPDSEIIISTWRDAPYLRRWANHIVINADPGELVDPSEGQNYLSNINRQIVSTRNGLAAGTRRFAAKLRTDTYLNDSRFLRYYSNETRKSAAPNFLTEKILVSALYCASPAVWPAPFFISDLFHFGVRADLMAYWNCDLCSANLAKQYSTFPFAWWRGGAGDRPEQIAAEQFLFSRFLRRNGVFVDPQRMLSTSVRNFVVSEWMFSRHFLPYPNALSGVNLPERLRQYDQASHYSFRSDFRFVAIASRRPWLSALWIAARIPLFYFAGVKAWLKFYLRPVYRAFRG